MEKQSQLPEKVTLFPLIWEEIDKNHFRCKTVGGWILKTYEDVAHNNEGDMDEGWDFRISTCFIPDITHEWSLEAEDTSI